MTIHPTASVDASAELAPGASVGAWSVVGPGVVLHEGVEVRSHVVIERDTVVGARTAIHPYAVVGGDPQHTGYRGELVRLEIGADVVIREHATLNRGTPPEHGGKSVTRIGSNVMMMTGAHVGHDCVVDDHVVMANNATLGGHVRVGEKCFLGGLCAVHQFGRVGEGAMIGGLSAVTRDVIPFGSVWGNHARLHGLNIVGLKRRGYDKAALRRLMGAYRDLFEGAGAFSERLDAAGAEYADLPEIIRIVAFIREDAKRPICLPGS